MCDPSGHKPVINKFNCYGYVLAEALGRYLNMSPGEIANPDSSINNENKNVYVIADTVMKDLRTIGGRCLGVGQKGLNAEIGDNEYMFALRIREENGAIHFMRMDSDGTWSEKTGSGPNYPIRNLGKGYTPEDDWDLYVPDNELMEGFKSTGKDPNNYFDSTTIYFAVPKMSP